MREWKITRSLTGITCKYINHIFLKSEKENEGKHYPPPFKACFLLLYSCLICVLHIYPHAGHSVFANVSMCTVCIHFYASHENVLFLPCSSSLSCHPHQLCIPNTCSARGLYMLKVNSCSPLLPSLLVEVFFETVGSL